MRKRGPGNRTPELRAIANAALARHNARRPFLPKCSAKAKHSGERCKRLAMANGKCHYHGGLTPKGDGYHQPVWPDPARRDAIEKLHRKLRDLQRAEKKRAKRIAAMSPLELERYRAWQRAHQPGPAGPRAQRRKEKADAKVMRARIERTERERVPSAEEQRLQAEIDRLEARLREMAEAPALPEVDIPTADPAPEEHDIFS